MKNLHKQVGNRIRELRKARGLSQEQLAEYADLHPTYIGEIERAETNVSLRTLQKIADALKTNVANLIPSPISKQPATEAELLTSQILGLVRNQAPRIQRAILNILKPLIDELRKMG